MSSGSSVLSSMLMQITYIIPYLIVYLIGIVIALTKMKQCSKPAMLTLIALIVLIITQFGQGLVQGYLIGQLNSGNYSGPSGSTMLSIVGWLGSFIRAAALGLLIAAVFVGRSKPNNSSDN